MLHPNEFVSFWVLRCQYVVRTAHAHQRDTVHLVNTAWAPSDVPAQQNTWLTQLACIFNLTNFN